MRTLNDLKYIETDGVVLELDLLLPDEAHAPVPVLLYFHGGGWVGGSRKSYQEERLFPAVHAGFAVASVTYRSSKQAVWPAQLTDAVAAVDYVRNVAPQYKLNVTRMRVWGASAGGHIAAMLAMFPTWPSTGDPNPLDACVAWFPPTDLENLATMPRPPKAVLPAFIEGEEVPPYEYWLVGAAPSDNAKSALREASPIHHVNPSSIPILLIHGKRDALVPAAQSQQLHNAMKRVGAPSQLILIDDATHEDAAFHSPNVLSATFNWPRLGPLRGAR